MEYSANNTTAALSRNPCVLPSPYISEPVPVRITRLSIEVGAALVGVLGNVLVCSVVITHRHLRPAHGLYIRSLAIADLGILLVNFPIAVMKEQMPGYWPLGRSMCYALYPVSEAFHGASIWSIVAISIERYRNIIYRTQQNESSTKLFILSMWVISFLIFVLPLLFFVSYDETPCGIFCTYNWPPLMHSGYIVLDVLLLYFIPLAVISSTYARLTRELNESTSLHRQIALLWTARQEEELEIVKQNARTKRMLSLLVTVFSITMLPLNVFRIASLCWNEFYTNELFLVFYNICVLGVVVNSSADPVIYSIVTKGFIAKLSFNASKRAGNFHPIKKMKESRV